MVVGKTPNHVITMSEIEVFVRSFNRLRAIESFGALLLLKGGQFMEEMMQYFLTQGPFAALFVWLLYYSQKRNKDREDQLYETLNEFASRYDIVIKRLDEIRNRLPPR